ncbi:hypothetical protein KY284_020930 [Solanum tuberosum]|nr:hypothetical protein KY284_020930 [Solanum tuberosum]
MMHGHAPSLAHIRVMELIRYPLYNLETKSCFISRDVVFYEDIFPFAQSSSAAKDPFMSLSSPIYSSQRIPNSVNHEVTTDSAIGQDDVDSPHVEVNVIPHDIAEAESSVIRNDVVDNVIPTPLRKYIRQHKPPTWLQDYVGRPPGAHACVYPISDVLGYSNLSPKYQAYIAKISVDCEPSNFKEAVKDRRWIEAMQSEIQALEDNCTWTVVDLPRGKRAIGCK